MRLFDLGLLALVATYAAPDQANTARALLESGKLQETVETVSGAEGPAPTDIFVGALAAQRLHQPEKARELFDRLRAGQPDEAPWSGVAASGIALVEGNAELALQEAKRAVAAGPGELAAQYQMGAVLYQMERFPEAAAAFAKAVETEPTFAYAHFYAGTAYQKDKRLDRMFEHFEAFLKLAPDAPEAPAVQSVMRTLRGR